MNKIIAVLLMLVAGNAFSLNNGKFESDGTSFSYGFISPTEIRFTIYLIEDKIIFIDQITKDIVGGYKTLEYEGERLFQVGDNSNNTFQYNKETNKYMMLSWSEEYQEYSVLIFDRVEGIKD